jgi:hypothetical protein
MWTWQCQHLYLSWIYFCFLLLLLSFLLSCLLACLGLFYYCILIVQRGFIVIFPYRHTIYIDHILPITLSYLPLVFSTIFKLCYFYICIQCTSIIFTSTIFLFLLPPSCWCPPPQTVPFYIHVILLGLYSAYERKGDICLRVWLVLLNIWSTVPSIFLQTM